MDRIVFVETDRLRLRQWLTTDMEPYIIMNQDPAVMEFFPALASASQSIEHAEKNRSRIDEKGYGLFAVERKEDHAFIGFTGFSHPSFELGFTPCYEIGWRLDRKYWNRGYATEAAKACLQFGFDRLQLSEVYSWTSVLNIRSEEVMKKIGLEKIGRFKHPLLPGHILEDHVLYKLARS